MKRAAVYAQVEQSGRAGALGLLHWRPQAEACAPHHGRRVHMHCRGDREQQPLRAASSTCTGRGFELMGFDGAASHRCRFSTVQERAWLSDGILGDDDGRVRRRVRRLPSASEMWGTRGGQTPPSASFSSACSRGVPDIRWDEIRHYVHPDVAVAEWITSGTPHGGTRASGWYLAATCSPLRDGRHRGQAPRLEREA